MSITVTSVTVRLALRKLAEITCGIAPTSVRVSVVPSGAHRVYVTSIPFEFRSEVYQYLAQHTAIRVPLNGDPLVLTGDEASVLVDLAYRAEQEEVHAPAVDELVPGN